MTGHDLRYIHPAKTLWQETMALVPEATYAAAPNQNQRTTHRLCGLHRTICRPHGSHASRHADDRAKPRNGARPKSP